jgi:hypothetical protein
MVKFEYFDADSYMEQARFAQEVDALDSFNRAFMRVTFIAMNYAVEGRKIKVIIGKDFGWGSESRDFVFGIQELDENGEEVGNTLFHGGIVYHGPGANPSADTILRRGNEHRWQIHT